MTKLTKFEAENFVAGTAESRQAQDHIKQWCNRHNLKCILFERNLYSIIPKTFVELDLIKTNVR